MIYINVVFMDMPVTVKSFLKLNPDDSATIVINARLSAEDRYKRYLHELEHLVQHDMESIESADTIEARAHGG